VPYQIFEAKDGDFVLAVGNDRQFAALCRKVVDLPDLANDPRFRTAKDRAIHRDDLLRQLCPRFRTENCAVWLERCAAAGIPAGVVKAVPDALAGPSVVGRDVIQSLDHPHLGKVRLVRPAHGLEAQKSAGYRAPPMLGQDTEDVLGRVLGYDAARIRDLIGAGAIAQYASAQWDMP
jgi:crotonobetainyl-CoA:carnitine CoA-transferase CaiB-like acyl-CoA transferase